ncbi:MAG TPA: hypothetical protein VGM00_14530, partial [Bradyrhizobium sp.]
MTSGGFAILGPGGGRRRLTAWALLALLAAAIPVSVSAQMFTDRPPPVPPESVPESPAGAMSLAPPPSGPASVPNLPAPLMQAPVAAMPPISAPPPNAASAGQAVLSLTARYGKDLPVISSGLVWRVFPDRPDETGTFKLIREEHGATPSIVLPPGNYVVHVAFGLVSAVR